MPLKAHQKEGGVTEAEHGKRPAAIVGALSERPSTSAGGRSESAPTEMTCRVRKRRKTLLAGLLLQPLKLAM